MMVVYVHFIQSPSQRKCVDRIIFPERDRNYNRERSSGNWLLITISFHVSLPVKIGDLIKAIVLEEQKGSLPVPEFVKLVPLLEEVNKRLLEAVTAEEDNNINLDKFGEFVLSAHMDVAPPEVAPPEDEVMVITAVQKWAWEVWVR